MSSPVSLSQTPRPHGELAISIIVPVFNKERYLAECLCSILSQTLEDIEVICVDDASSDNSPAILDEIGRADPRVVVYRNPINLGSGA